MRLAVIRSSLILKRFRQATQVAVAATSLLLLISTENFSYGAKSSVKSTNESENVGTKTITEVILPHLVDTKLNNFCLKKGVISKIMNKGDRSIISISKEVGVPQTTLVGWMKNHGSFSPMKKQKSSYKWTSEKKLQVLIETGSLKILFLYAD